MHSTQIQHGGYIRAFCFEFGFRSHDQAHILRSNISMVWSHLPALGNNTTIQCLARPQAGNHNIGLPMVCINKQSNMCSRLILLCRGIRVFYFFMPKIQKMFINNMINTIGICQIRCGRINLTRKMRYEDILVTLLSANDLQRHGNGKTLKQNV